MNQFIGFMVLLGIFCLVTFPIIIRANRKLTAEQRAAHRDASDRDCSYSGDDSGPGSDSDSGGSD